MFSKRRLVAGFSRFIAFAALAAFAFPAAKAQKPWPQDRPIQIHIGQPAGYAPDLTVRWLSEYLSKELGQSVVVINKPSGGGRAMLNDLRKAPADGYTFSNVFWHMMATWPALFSNLEFNPAEDFSYVGIWGNAPQMLVTYPGSGFNDFKEAVAKSKTAAQAVQYGTYGATSPGTIYMASAVKQTGAKMEPVHFKGADAPQGILRKDVPLLVGGVVDVQEYIKSGSMMAIAVSGSARLAAFPNVPTFAELGVSGLEAGIWAGIVAPPGLPKDISEKMNAALRRAATHPEHVAKATSVARMVSVGSGAEMQAQIRRDVEQWSKVIREAGIKIQ